MKRDNDGKVKDIRYEMALGWNDIRNREYSYKTYKRNIFVRIGESIQSIRDISENF
jgi:hypothetical protein